MTKQEAKDAALRWLDEATSGGSALDQGSTADLEDRMDHLLDGAVAAVCGRFPHYAVFCVECTAPQRQEPAQPFYARIRLPEDFSALHEVRLAAADGSSVPFSEYRRVGKGEYTVPAVLNGTLEFTYIRLPAVLGAAAEADAELDVEPEAVVLVPLRLAADILVGVDETAVLSGYLLARYNEMAAALYRRAEPDRAAVECVYAP